MPQHEKHWSQSLVGGWVSNRACAAAGEAGGGWVGRLVPGGDGTSRRRCKRCSKVCVATAHLAVDHDQRSINWPPTICFTTLTHAQADTHPPTCRGVHRYVSVSIICVQLQLCVFKRYHSVPPSKDGDSSAQTQTHLSCTSTCSTAPCRSFVGGGASLEAFNVKNRQRT